MPGMYIACFSNQDRPPLKYSCVTEIPVNVLGTELASKLEVSLKVSSLNWIACAKSARLWEELLEDHRIPYLLLKVADMRTALGSRVTGLKLYEELQDHIDDLRFGQWISEYSLTLFRDLDKDLKLYKTASDFTPSLRWRLIDHPFPYCRLQRAQIKQIHDAWTKDIVNRFLNMHCLETNSIEGTFRFKTEDTSHLIATGFDVALDCLHHPTGGAVRNDLHIALSILRDTHHAIEDAITLSQSQPINLTVPTISRLHKILMQTSQVLSVEGHRRLTYLNLGITRQASHVNVKTVMQDQGMEMKLQFCPYDQVDKELGKFCEDFNELMQDTDIDPFAAAAWIQHVFITIHPFEDGNGRLSRVLASIPLLKRGLPPLCIPLQHRNRYQRALNITRADSNGDYEVLMTVLYDATKTSLVALTSPTQ